MESMEVRRPHWARTPPRLRQCGPVLLGIRDVELV